MLQKEDKEMERAACPKYCLYFFLNLLLSKNKELQTTDRALYSIYLLINFIDKLHKAQPDFFSYLFQGILL